MKSECRICGKIGAYPRYEAAEKMFGIGDRFFYFQCSACKCLQIEEVPKNLALYYPPNYYSFHSEHVPREGAKARLGGLRDSFAVTRRGLLGRWLELIKRPTPEVEALGKVPLRKEMRILDVGCGSGRLLCTLYRAGFRELCGVDPFIASDVTVAPGVMVQRRALQALDGTFDLIMFHHVFEHINPGEEPLGECESRLTNGGAILLRLPTVDGEAWARYRENWVALDAPRHLVLHSRTSLEIQAKRHGLTVSQWVYDSSAFQFWGSELYIRGVPLIDSHGGQVDPENHFNKDQLSAFERESVLLNRRGAGDQVIAILRRPQKKVS